MDNEILKLLPQKAFKLLSIRETVRIGADVSGSILNKASYEKVFQARLGNWKFDDITMTKDFSSPLTDLSTIEDGERVLKIYFSQFFEKGLATHIDLRKKSFSSLDSLSNSIAGSPSNSLLWIPSKLHYSFSQAFLEGVCSMYAGFYLNKGEEFEKGLVQLGMIRETMSEKQKNEMKDLFYAHFGEGRLAPVKFSLENLKQSFNSIFSHFLKEDIPLNPEFAVLGICLVTLYLTLQDIPHPLNVRSAFLETTAKYKN